MLESKFQRELIAELHNLFPGCIVIKNDPNYLQGFPDLTIFYEDRWALLECKKSADASHQPNQDFYIHKASAMSYGAFIFPENREEILNELEQALHKGR